MKNGKAPGFLLEEVQSTIKAAGDFKELRPYCKRLEEALEKCRVVTMHRAQFAMR